MVGLPVAMSGRAFPIPQSKAICKGLLRACHDLSEGGLAVAVAEMAFAGGFGAQIRLKHVPRDGSLDSRQTDDGDAILFSESASRFIVEVPPGNRAAIESIFRSANVPFGHIGEVTDSGRLVVLHDERPVIDLPLAEMKEAWQKPLRW